MQATTLPQELIDLIIDLVVFAAEDRTDELNALRTCSLISPRLFSKIIFRADGLAQKRAHALLGVLDGSVNDDLVHYIRSFTLIIDMSTSSLGIFDLTRPNALYQRAGAAFTGLWRRLGLWDNHLLSVLDRLGHASLRHFTFEAQNGVLDWRGVNEDFYTMITTLRSHETLESLHFINITHLEKSLVTQNAPANNLQELGLWNTSLSPSLSQGAPLTTLAVSFPQQSVDIAPFCQMVESLSSSLETLEIRNYAIHTSSGFDPRSMYEPLSLTLRRLQSLRNLHIDILNSAWDCFYVTPLTIVFFFNHSEPRLGLESLTIALSIPAMFIQSRLHVLELYFEHLRHSMHILDGFLKQLLSLRAITLKLKYVPYPKRLPFLMGDQKDTIGNALTYGASDFFPDISSSGFVEVKTDHLIEVSQN
ncbi:hypothetical protein CPB84DRAFT_1783415 [Gymnopilus junonius]|uniref:Uncharacterized protein n=1 Tax=Gymnopilus junonius TaxID=109634 RepID=A0A9P5NMD4_GYMJU|nr:hypothetical protein CPB84DRAFT_1783415 [Gymnopilus junonius]